MCWGSSTSQSFGGFEGNSASESEELALGVCGTVPMPMFNRHPYSQKDVIWTWLFMKKQMWENTFCHRIFCALALRTCISVFQNLLETGQTSMRNTLHTHSNATTMRTSSQTYATAYMANATASTMWHGHGHDRTSIWQTINLERQREREESVATFKNHISLSI